MGKMLSYSGCILTRVNYLQNCPWVLHKRKLVWYLKAEKNPTTTTNPQKTKPTKQTNQQAKKPTQTSKPQNPTTKPINQRKIPTKTSQNKQKKPPPKPQRTPYAEYLGDLTNVSKINRSGCMFVCFHHYAIAS